MTTKLCEAKQSGRRETSGPLRFFSAIRKSARFSARFDGRASLRLVTQPARVYSDNEGLAMSHKRKGMFSTSGEWGVHLRPDGRRAFWKQERHCTKVHIRKQSEPPSDPNVCRCPSPRPALFPEWLTDTVVAIARAMDESGTQSALPILADALEEAGCDNEGVLSYCRNPCRHIRGCWVVDLVLGKE